MLRTTSRPSLAFTTIAAALLLLGAHASLAAEEKASALTTEGAVRALEGARAQALLKADTTALSRLIAAEFVEISRLGQIRTKADNLREIANGELKLTSVKYDSLEVRIYGDVALLRGLADNTGTYRGFPFAGNVRYTRVFVRRDGAGRRWPCSTRCSRDLPAAGQGPGRRSPEAALP